MKSLLNLMLCVCVGAMVLAGCNSSGNQTAPTTDTVIISGMKFHPAELYVNKWDTVIWINQDLVAHDVTEFPEKEWTSDTIAVDQSWKKVINKSFDYFCSIHVTMKGKVIVRQ